MVSKVFLLVALILLCVLVGATGLAAGTCESDCAATKSSCDGDCDTIWNDCYWTCESNWYNCKDSCDMTYDGCMGDCDTNWYNCNDNCDMTYDGCMGDCDMNWNSCRGDCDMMYDGCCMDCDMMYDPGTPEHEDCMMQCEMDRDMCYDGCDGTKNDCEMQCDGERWTCHDDCDMTKSNCESGCAGDRTSCYSPCDTEKTSCEGICDGTKTSCLGDCSDNYVICLASCSPVPDPINIAHTKGLFWVNHTWDIEPGGDIIDSFNVSINQTWYNSTTDMFYNNTGLSTWGQWSNITVWAFNNTNGSSDASVSENVQLPMPIPAVPVGTGGTWDFYWVNHSWAAGSSYGIWCGETDSYNYSVTTHLLGGSPNTVWYNDSTNTSHNNSLGVYGWSNITVYAFNDTAGINETYIYQDVQVPKYIPADPTNLQHTFGYYWANHTWDEGAGGYATDSYNVSIEGKGWYNGTLHTWHKDVLSVHGWSNITVYAFNSTHAVLSVNPVTADVYVPHEHANMVNINQTGWWLTGGAFTMSGTPLQDGFNNMISGHGAYVYAGAYTESVTISIAHTTITTEGKDVVNITSPSGSHCIDVNADHVTLSGFELSNATTVNCAGVYIANQQYCTISDIHTHNNHFGLYPDSSTHIEFTNINSHSNGQTAQFGGGSYINVTDSICNGIYLVSTSHNTCTNVSCGTITLYQGGSHVFDRCAISHITQNSWTGSITIRDHVTETLRYTGWGHGFSLTITNTGGRVFTTSKDTATTAFPNGMFTCAPITSFYPYASMYIYQQDATIIPSTVGLAIADWTFNNDVVRNETLFNANCTDVGNAFWINITKESWANSKICVIANDNCIDDTWVGADGVMKYHYTAGFDTNKSFVFRPNSSIFVQHPIGVSYNKGYPTWVNWTWGLAPSFCCWLKADSFNVSVRGTWYNNTTDIYYNDTGFAWDVPSNIVVYTYNNTHNKLSTFNVVDSTFVPTPTIDGRWNSYTDDTALIIEHIPHTTLPQTINFSITANEIIPEWVWTGVDTVYNETNSTTSNASKTFTEFGTFDVSVTGTDGLGGQTPTITWTVSTDLQWIGHVSLSMDQCSGYGGMYLSDTDHAPSTYPYGVVYYEIYYLSYWNWEEWCLYLYGAASVNVKSGSTYYAWTDADFPGDGGVWSTGSIDGTGIGDLSMAFHKYYWGCSGGCTGIWFESKRMNATVYAYTTDGIREVSGNVSCVDNVTLYENMSGGMIGYLTKDETHLDGAYSFHTAHGIDYVLEFVSDEGYSYYRDFTGSMVNQTIDFNACHGQYIVLKDGSGNLIHNAAVSIYDTTDNVYVHKWKTNNDGILNFSIGSYSNHTLLIVVNTFDGVFTQEVYFGPEGGLTTITIPIRYNMNIHPKDEQGVPLTDVFCGLSEYAPLNPRAFWGYSMYGSQCVPITNTSGFQMCDIYAEKGGYEDYNATALNWTSKSARIKDYRHTATLTKE